MRSKGSQKLMRTSSRGSLKHIIFCQTNRQRNSMMMLEERIYTQAKQQGWEGMDNSSMEIGRIRTPIRRKINIDNNLTNNGRRHRRMTTPITIFMRMPDKHTTRTLNGHKIRMANSHQGKKLIIGGRLQILERNLKCLSFFM